MEISLEIKKRNRDFGIITWPNSFDNEVESLFDRKESINIEIGDKIYRNRKVSYKYRKFSNREEKDWNLSGQEKIFFLKKG
jgi:hypothetical protein